MSLVTKLAPPPGATELRDSITLVSSTGQRIPFNRLLLAGTSTVFRDMFEVCGSTATTSAPECQVSETASELYTLKSALDAKLPNDETSWLALYRIADKYDMRLLYVNLRAALWERRKADPLFAYSAAALLSDHALMREAAEECYNKATSDQNGLLWKTLPEADRLRLRLYAAERRNGFPTPLTFM